MDTGSIVPTPFYTDFNKHAHTSNSNNNNSLLSHAPQCDINDVREDDNIDINNINVNNTNTNNTNFNTTSAKPDPAA